MRNIVTAGMAAHHHPQEGPPGAAGVATPTPPRTPHTQPIQTLISTAALPPQKGPPFPLPHPCQSSDPRLTAWPLLGKRPALTKQKVLVRGECALGKMMQQLQMSSQLSGLGLASGTSRRLTCLLLTCHQRHRYSLPRSEGTCTPDDDCS